MAGPLLAAEAAPSRPRAFPGWRHAISALLFFAGVICYSDRTNMGILLAHGELPGVPPHSKGRIFAAFFVGYFLTQVVGGILARRYGSKPTLILAVAVWTLSDLLTPLAARLGAAGLIADRVVMGLGEGMLYPSQHALSAFWVPAEERACLIAFMTSGQDAGSILANLASPHLLHVGPWCLFLVWGALGVLWCLAYARWGASAPETHDQCVASGEAAWIQTHRGASHFDVARKQCEMPIPVRLLRQPCIWAIFAAHSGVNYIWYVRLSWMPTWFKGIYNLDLKRNPEILAGTYVLGWAGQIMSGWVSDGLVARGFRVRHVRKVMQTIGLVMGVVLFQLAVWSDTAATAAVLMSLCTMFGKFQNAGYWVNMLDVCPEAAATVMALSNTIATIPGIVGQPITQAIVNSYGGETSKLAWSIAFGFGGLVQLGLGAVFLALADDVSLDGAIPSARSASNIEIAVVS